MSSIISPKKAYEQRPKAVRQWLHEQYPQIAAQAKAEKAEIHWIDETAVVNTDVRGRCYAPKGQTPTVMMIGGSRHKLSMIASVNNRGKAQWMVIDEARKSYSACTGQHPLPTQCSKHVDKLAEFGHIRGKYRRNRIPVSIEAGLLPPGRMRGPRTCFTNCASEPLNRTTRPNPSFQPTAQSCALGSLRAARSGGG